MAETKQCVRCGETFPATTEFFYEDRSRIGKCSACEGSGSRNGRTCKACKGTGGTFEAPLRASCKTCWGEQAQDSGWSSTPREARHRKGIELTLPDEARERLTLMAKRAHMSRSEMAAVLIMAAPMPKDVK
jgi:hypothetical protein